MIKPTLFTLLGVFLINVGIIVVPDLGPSIGPPYIFIPWIAFFLLGFFLIYLTIKEKIGGSLRKFLLLTGSSGVGFLASIVLHNLFYGVGVVTERILILHHSAEAFHVLFFLVGLLSAFQQLVDGILVDAQGTVPGGGQFVAV